MRKIDQVYIGGAFVTPHGSELSPLFNPATEEVVGEVRLADEADAEAAIAAAKRALVNFSTTGKRERIDILERVSAAIAKRVDELKEAMIEEYGGTKDFVDATMPHAASVFLDAARTLESYELTRPAGGAIVSMQPVGVAAVITPWNHSVAFICEKVSSAIAAGCTTVVKPSELSALQTQIMTECFDDAGVPAGLINVVTGRGDVVGEVLSRHPDVAKVSFTGSTAVGQRIMRNGAETMKRVTLELGGKGPSVFLDDADLEAGVPAAIAVGFANNGQACFAGTRILAPDSRLEEVLDAVRAVVPTFKVGDPRDPSTALGPLVNQRQYDRVQSYIRLGRDEGAQILVGGEGRPEGLDKGWFTRPTVFTGVSNDMRIAREEIFGPVLCVISYRDEDEAVAIANDTPYGLQAYVFSADAARARRIADRLESGTVLINGARMDPRAPHGGVKMSGLGREHGVYGMEAYLEPRAVIA
ncbi:aldehyde dehydrogenase family protein [Planotetraspora kaengkrachanensis]|uniref:Aldehyde dehydrogenase n=1 Tax=Planotetraspora kaengkrachanensis TaxID=575193 RepID=A0A8J3PQ16_9ACTN|nr:aldehyde dehydrogenase family protein [Planotetraspora kaengkrachanensis]GIG77657.1 aldehyde dehydrogenase [Planotetraspora kaengkrachanensis]